MQVIAMHGPAISPAALDAMPYADAVIREALRIAPPAASVFRRTLVDMEVGVCATCQTLCHGISACLIVFQPAELLSGWATAAVGGLALG